MAGDVDFKLDTAQYNTVIARLGAVSAMVKKKSGRAALRKGANVIRDAARARARSIDDAGTTENIARNIMAQFNSRLFKRTGDIGFRIGVRGGAVYRKVNGDTFGYGGSRKNPGGDTWYWRLLEFGTKDIAARSIMRPALSENIESASTTFANALEIEIDKAVRAGRAQ